MTHALINAPAANTGASAHTPPAHMLEDPRHPVVRRVADVLRSRPAKPKIFVLDDVENIEQALRSGVRLDSLYMTADAELSDAIVIAAHNKQVPIHVLGRRTVKNLFAGERRARVFALAHAPPRCSLRELTDRPGDIVVLNGVRLVGNIGAITRTSCALGAAGIVLLDHGLRTLFDRRVVRASRGLVLSIPMVLSTREEFCAFARNEELILVSVSAEAATTINSVRDLPQRIGLVLGGERKGISGELDALTSHRYMIPMTSYVESLNVSVAAGIALYEHRLPNQMPRGPTHHR